MLKLKYLGPPVEGQLFLEKDLATSEDLKTGVLGTAPGQLDLQRGGREPQLLPGDGQARVPVCLVPQLAGPPFLVLEFRIFESPDRGGRLNGEVQQRSSPLGAVGQPQAMIVTIGLDREHLDQIPSGTKGVLRDDY